MFYTIYKTTNTINGKFYIGKHQTENPNDDYFGSGLAIKAAIKKYGRKSFIKEVLFVFDTEADMNLKEKELLTESFVSDRNNYNKGVGGEGGPHFKGKTHTKEAREKFARPGKKLSKESREKISKANMGRHPSAETRKKLAEAATGRILSEETKKKISDTLKKRNASSHL